MAGRRIGEVAEDPGFRATFIEYPQRNINAWHPEEEKYMPYQIGAPVGYSIGAQQYAIADPRYMIGAPMPAPWLQAGPSALQAFHGTSPVLSMMPNVAPAPMLPSMSQQAIPIIPMHAPTIVTKQDPTESRIQPVPCNFETDIAVGATQTAVAAPQKIFKPERLVIPATVAPDFLVQVFVGVALQQPVKGFIAAESFLPESIYSNVDFDTCQISQQLNIDAKNRGGAPRPYYSTFYGRVLQ